MNCSISIANGSIWQMNGKIRKMADRRKAWQFGLWIQKSKSVREMANTLVCLCAGNGLNN